MWDFKNILKEIMVENIPNLAEDIKFHIEDPANSKQDK